jgi:hypothetical protein
MKPLGFIHGQSKFNFELNWTPFTMYDLPHLGRRYGLEGLIANLIDGFHHGGAHFGGQ